MSEKPIQEDKATVAEAEDQAIAQDLEKGNQASEDLHGETQDQANADESGAFVDDKESSPEQQKINELENELVEAGTRYLRLQADYDNFRRRTREEKSQERK
ncbi:MAG TPA: nucleotide exchange factor GrpE, partial [Sporolactobacillaceae bacterium]|nr:nucleotide exchange factor GrpE [Sporolactobacillaceae bacterium]